MVPAPNTPSNFQRIGSASNAHVGTAFERVAAAALQAQGVVVAPSFALPSKDFGFAELKRRQHQILECEAEGRRVGSEPDAHDSTDLIAVEMLRAVFHSVDTTAEHAAGAQIVTAHRGRARIPTCVGRVSPQEEPVSPPVPGEQP